MVVVLAAALVELGATEVEVVVDATELVVVGVAAFEPPLQAPATRAAAPARTVTRGVRRDVGKVLELPEQRDSLLEWWDPEDLVGLGC